MQPLLFVIGPALMHVASAQAEPTAPATKPADVKAMDALIGRMVDEKASWEVRHAAEDDLAKFAPEQVLPRLLRQAAKKMPEGPIYNGVSRDADKHLPVRWQIWYALGRSWSAQTERLPFKTGGETLVEMLITAGNDAEKNLVVRELDVRWSPRAEAPTAKILLDPAADMDLRVAAASCLVARGKKTYQDDMLRVFDTVSHADRMKWIEVLTSQRNKKRTGIDPRTVVRGFQLLIHEEALYRKEVVKRSEAFHGGYFATNWISDYLGEKFQPYHEDPRYENTGRRDPRWFADTVGNALKWWAVNRGKFNQEK
jgi:hypothetical protein